MGCGSSKTSVLTSQPKQEHFACPSQVEQSSETSNYHSCPEVSKQKKEVTTSLSDLGLEISFEEAASLRLHTPMQMWTAVKKTCTPNKKWIVEKNKSRRGWKTIRLFVSSTFKDFHIEREVLVKEVCFCFVKFQLNLMYSRSGCYIK